MINTLRITKIAALLALALAVTVPAHAGGLKAASQEAVQNFKQADPSLSKFFRNSVGYAILPSVGEGGLIIAGKHGDGLLYEKGKVTGKVTMSAVTIGAQVGGGKFSEVIFFETNAALNSFKGSNYEMSAAAKASIAASGVAARAKYEQGVAVFTLPKSGAMVAAAVGGQKFKFEPIQ
jgi:lipid-binding SYLF domain-containing protein